MFSPSPTASTGFVVATLILLSPAIVFSQALNQNSMPSESEINKYGDNLIKMKEIVTRIQSAIDMCDRRIGVGEKSLETTCNDLIKVFDKLMRPFFADNNRTINLVIYPKTLELPPPLNFTAYHYWFIHGLYSQEFLKIGESCREDDATLLKLCISLINDALLKYQEVNSEASPLVAQIMNINPET